MSRSINCGGTMIPDEELVREIKNGSETAINLLVRMKWYETIIEV